MMISNENGLQKITAIKIWEKKYPNIFALLNPCQRKYYFGKKKLRYSIVDQSSFSYFKFHQQNSWCLETLTM